jgi:hypothetical protein
MIDAILSIIIPGILLVTVIAWLFVVLAWLRRR